MMHKKKLFAIGVVLISILFLVSAVSYADELTDIQSAIKAKGAKWTAGETSMMKLSKEERKKRLGVVPDAVPSPESSVVEEAVSAVPAGLDWRNNGGDFVTPVRNQASCGSCWAFAAAGAAESAWLIANNWSGMNLDLAEQILISCYDTDGCNGGSPSGASSYIQNTGLPEETCFPYRALDSSEGVPCSNACLNWQNSTYKIDSYSGVSKTVDAIRNALNTNGPLVTTFAVYNDFFSYTSGVYTHVTGDLAGYHAVVIIGYDDVGQYFIAKNSWGAGWGSTADYGTERGYFKIAYSQLSNEVGFGNGTLKYSLASPNSTITVVSPNSGETWQAGTTQTIAWNYTGSPGAAVKIELYKGASLNRVIISSTSAGATGSGSYSWPIPSDVAFGADYLVKVTSTIYSSVADISDANFTINPAATFGASGLVTSASNGSALSGAIMTFSRVSGSGTIPANVTTDASGIWSQSGFQQGTTYKVTPSLTGYTFSPASSNFSANAPGLNFSGTPPVPANITVTAPNGGERVKVGSTVRITWSYTGSVGTFAKIELLKGGQVSSTLTSNAKIAGGYYNWKISTRQAVGTDYQIRITSTSNSSAKDTSNANFEIYK
jgi:C1A family cysteine protease